MDWQTSEDTVPSAPVTEADARLLRTYAHPAAWDRMAVLNVAGSRRFSSDRTIRQYAEEIWHAAPCPVP